MPAPKDWWSDLGGTKPGPARIRVTFNRDFTPAEEEHLRALGAQVHARLGDKFRLNNDGRLYVESHTADSRQLFNAVAAVVASSFVNVFPLAVRTFRERVVGSTPKGYATGGVVKLPSTGLMDTVAATLSAHGPVTTTTANAVVEYRTEPGKKKKKGKK